MSRKPEFNVVAFSGAPERGVPPKPEAVEDDPIASAEWDRVVSLGVVDARHVAMLMVYCSRFAMTVRCLNELNAYTGPLVVETERGGEKAHPLLSQLNESERLLGIHAAKLNLTPSSGAKTKDDKPAAGKKLGKYLR